MILVLSHTHSLVTTTCMDMTILGLTLIMIYLLHNKFVSYVIILVLCHTWNHLCMSCQHRDFLSEELASLSVQEPVSPWLAKGYTPEGNWPALFHLSPFLISYCYFVCCTYSGVYS